MNDLQTLWDEFLAEWPIERVKNMTLEQYVGVEDKTTFTYWVETKTQAIANIKGSPSYKFGIFKRDPKKKEIKERVGAIQGQEYAWFSRFGETELDAFTSVKACILSVIEAAQENDLDAIDTMALANIFKWKIAFLYQNRDEPSIVNIFSKDKLDELIDLPGKPSFPDYYQALMLSYDPEKYNSVADYGRFLWSQLDDEVSDESRLPAAMNHDTNMKAEKLPLNQILYGPPGTGKTYHTIEVAVKAAEPLLYDSIINEPVKPNDGTVREKLEQAYKSLVAKKRIRFVTFHQSYGYEEFVEGLKAKNDDEGNIHYQVEDGVFKSICEDAKGDKYQALLKENLKPKVWKISIEWAGESQVCNDCFEQNIARIGWGKTGNLNSPDSLTEENLTYFKGLGRNEKSSVIEFSQNANVGDVVVVLSSVSTIKAVGIVSGEYYHQPEGHPLQKSFGHVLPVNWLVKNVNLPIVDINGGVTLTQKTFYHLWRVKPHDVFELIEKHKLAITETLRQANQNYVLIIDEINRGNISKIFGELITLIEPTKRSGTDVDGKEPPEALTINLSYTPQKPFSVPNNLYLIGTMNTADRSLAMMDTALRRRFDFIEMMPKPELFSGKTVFDIELDTLLSTMNQRIEVLYDREHTLGHAFFMPVIDVLNAKGEDAAFIKLQQVFKNKIIPLLEEYFFEDWNKIRLVLGDNRKNTELLRQFVFVQENTASYDEVFGEGHGLETYEDKKTTYQLADFNDVNGAWHNALAYQAIYDPSVLPKALSAYAKDNAEALDSPNVNQEAINA
ncbi:AAA family ATPase [Thalassotalea ganghwensis]